MSETTRITIGKHIKVLRKDRGFTLNQFALMIGMDRSYLGKIEAGKINTSIDKLERIAEGLGLSLFEFFKALGNGE